MTSSTGSRSNPALGSCEGVIIAIFNLISHLYLSTAQVYCASSPPSPLPFPKPHSSFCSPDKMLLRPIHFNSHSTLRSSLHPPPCRMSAHPLYFLQLCLWFYCDLSTFHVCYSWLSLSLGEIADSLSTGTLTCYCWISRLWHTTGGMCLKKKKLVGCQSSVVFSFFSASLSFHLPLALTPLSFFAHLFLHL